jgi:hypothetical protein
MSFKIDFPRQERLPALQSTLHHPGAGRQQPNPGFAGVISPLELMLQDIDIRASVPAFKAPVG